MRQKRHPYADTETIHGGDQGLLKLRELFEHGREQAVSAVSGRHPILHFLEVLTR